MSDVVGLTSLVALMLVACGRTTSLTESASRIGRDCIIAQPPTTMADTLRIALQHEVDLSHAPIPDHFSDKLLFRQLYQTLIRVDCKGRVASALARSWRGKEGGRRWSFTLRTDARFWDGTPLTAALVVASWRETGAAERHGLNPDSLFVGGEQEVEVAFTRPHRSVPTIFAAAEMAVVRRSTGSAWPSGTGPYRIVSSESGRVRAERVASPGSGTGPALEFQVLHDRDPRDVIDDRYDLLITGDATTLDYAVTKPDRDLVALPWDASYVLLTPPYVTGAQEGLADVQPGLPLETRQALARDAVTVDARSSASPPWFEQLGRCETPRVEQWAPPGISEQETARIAFESADAVAGSLAERLVALVGLTGGRELLQQLGVEPVVATSVASGRIPLQAVALEAEAFAQELMSGQSMAYVLPLQRATADPCRSASDLVARAGWLIQPGSSVSAYSQLQLSGAVVPLVETRRHAVVYRGSLGLAVDWDDVPILLLP